MSPSHFTLINGKSTEAVSVDDRGLQFGDGLFETIACMGGELRFVDYHLDRLRRGCERLGLPPPPEARLRNELAQAADGRDRAVVKLILTRGRSSSGYGVPPHIQATRVVSVRDWPKSTRPNRVVLRICKTRLGRNPSLAGIKHLNRLEQVLARMEWGEDDSVAGLMLDPDGHPVETTSANLFLVRAGELVTPELSQCGIAGVMRRVVLDCARAAGIPTHEKVLSVEELLDSDEVFITNALIGVRPIVGLDHHGWPQGTVTEQLANAVDRLEV